MTIPILFIYSATSVVEAYDLLENRLSSVCNRVSTSTGMNTSEILTEDNNTTVPRSSTPTGTQNRVMETLCKTNISIVSLKVSYKLNHLLRLLTRGKCNLNWDDTL
jgi:hypothetical protein